MPDGAPLMMDLWNILLIKFTSTGVIQWTAMYGEGTGEWASKQDYEPPSPYGLCA